MCLQYKVTQIHNVTGFENGFEMETIKMRGLEPLNM